MAKFKVELGSLVTRLMHRKITVFANNENEAIEKAKNKFYEIAHSQPYTDIVESVYVDDIEQI